MNKKGYALCDGMVYKKPPEAKVCKCLKKTKLAELLTPCMDKCVEFLSDPACSLITPITHLLNAIEVLPPGTLFLIAEKRFVRMKSLDKHLSSRTFVTYTYTYHQDRVPYPLPFIQGSLMTNFCNYYIKSRFFFVSRKVSFKLKRAYLHQTMNRALKNVIDFMFANLLSCHFIL